MKKKPNKKIPNKNEKHLVRRKEKRVARKSARGYKNPFAFRIALAYTQYQYNRRKNAMYKNDGKGNRTLECTNLPFINVFAQRFGI